MSPIEHSIPTLPQELAVPFRPICARFAADWQAGRRPRLEDFLTEVEEPDRPALLLELLTLELQERTHRGEGPTVAEYHLRLPRHATVIDQAFAILTVGLGPPAGMAAPPTAVGGAAGLTDSGARASGAGPAAPAQTGALGRAGRYEVQTEIAHGGMGSIWLARDPELNRALAIKVLRPEYLGRPEVERRFREEAQITGQLQHPGIPPVHEVGTLPDGRPFLAMKLIKGRTLAELLHERPSPAAELPRFLGIFEQVCQTLAYAHSKGVIHRDLKPSNIMVGAFGEVQVMDWGLAKILSSRAREAPETDAEACAIVTARVGATGLSSQAGTVLGTPAYMPPEQARGDVQQLDERCDVFGLGAILCEILTGQPPYIAETGWGLLLAAQADLAKVFARLEGSGADADLVALAKRCLAAEPEERLRDAGIVAEQVTAYLASVQERLRAAEIERAAAEAKGAEARARAAAERRARRLTVVLGTVGLGLLVLLSGGTFWWWHQNQTLEREIGLRHEAKAHAQRAQEEAARAQTEKARADQSAGAARAEKLRADRLLYAVHLRQAQQAWEEGDIRRVRDLLDEHKPAPGAIDLRGWEWHYQTRLLEDSLKRLQGHTGGVTALAFSPDGKQVATASLDRTVKLWDAATGKELRSLRHEESVWHLAFSPDGARLASATGDSIPPPLKDGQLAPPARGPVARVRVWDLAARRVVHTFQVQAHYTDRLAFSGDGKRLLWTGSAVGGQESRSCRVKAWDPATGQEVGLPIAGAVASAAFSPDGTRLATAAKDSTIRLWDIAAGREMQTLGGHTGRVRIEAFSSDGKRLVTSAQDGVRKVWDLVTGQALCTLKQDRERTERVWLSPDGTRLASVGRSGVVTLRDATSGQVLHTLRGHKAQDFDLGMGPVRAVSFSPDGQWLASIGSDRTVKLWDVATGQEIRTFGCQDVAYRAAFSPDGKRLIAAGEGPHVHLWDIPISSELRAAAIDLGAPFAALERRGFRVGALKLAFSPDGRQLASAGIDGKIKLWDAATERELRVLTGHPEAVLSVAFSADGTRLVSASRKHIVKVWDAATGKELRSFTLRKDKRSGRSGESPPGQPKGIIIEVEVPNPFGGENLCIAVSPHGTRVAAAAEDGTVTVWDVATGRELHRCPGKQARPLSLVFSRDETRLAWVAGSRAVMVWDVARGQRVQTLTVDKKRTGTVTVQEPGRPPRTEPSYEQDAWGLAFSPDGQRLAWVCPNRTIQVWDVGSGQKLQTLQGHREEVWGTVFSPDGTRLVSAGADGLVKIWDAATGQELRSLRILERAPDLKLGLFGPKASDAIGPWNEFDVQLHRHASTLAFSPDGLRLASASANHTVRVWDARPRTP
jgi:WD40 repeat protein/tRNA A-37 threonylcarbamoyl transferase component Bud32